MAALPEPGEGASTDTGGDGCRTAVPCDGRGADAPLGRCGSFCSSGLTRPTDLIPSVIGLALDGAFVSVGVERAGFRARVSGIDVGASVFPAPDRRLSTGFV